MDLLRAVILGAVEHDQHMAAEPAEHVGAAVDPPKLIDRFREYRVQQRWRGRVEYVPNVIVAGILAMPNRLARWSYKSERWARCWTSTFVRFWIR